MKKMHLLYLVALTATTCSVWAADEVKKGVRKIEHAHFETYWRPVGDSRETYTLDKRDRSVSGSRGGMNLPTKELPTKQAESKFNYLKTKYQQQQAGS